MVLFMTIFAVGFRPLSKSLSIPQFFAGPSDRGLDKVRPHTLPLIQRPHTISHRFLNTHSPARDPTISASIQPLTPMGRVMGLALRTCSIRALI